MTTVWYLDDSVGDDVVDGLQRVSSRLSVVVAGPETAADPPSADCVVTTPEAVCEGRPVAQALRAAGYDGAVVLFGSGSHDALAAATDHHGADTYVRRDVEGETHPWHRLAEAVERVTTTPRRGASSGLALPADRMADLLNAEDDVAVAAVVVETVSALTGGDAALVSITASGDDQVDVHVVAATGGFDPTRLDASDIANTVDAGTELVTVDDQGQTSRTVVVVPVDAQRGLVVSGRSGRELLASDVRTLARLTAIAFDSSRRVRALHREHDRLASLFENTSDAIAEIEYVDGEPRVRNVNPSFERLFGLPRDEIVGTNLDDHVVPDAEGPSADMYRRRALTGEPYEQEVTRLTADGQREFLLRSVPLSQEGSTQGYAIYTDITE